MGKVWKRRLVWRRREAARAAAEVAQAAENNAAAEAQVVEAVAEEAPPAHPTAKPKKASAQKTAKAKK